MLTCELIQVIDLMHVLGRVVVIALVKNIISRLTCGRTREKNLTLAPILVAVINLPEWEI
jgi:hypothetical protein